MENQVILSQPGEYTITNLRGVEPVVAVIPLFTASGATIASAVAAMEYMRSGDGELAVCFYNPEKHEAQVFVNIEDDRAPVISARMRTPDDLVAWRLNGPGWSAQELALHIRFNRHMVADVDANALVAALMDFKAKIAKEIEDMRKEDGTSARASISRDITVVVKPEPFSILAPMFVGGESYKLPVKVRYEEDRANSGVLLYLECESLAQITELEAQQAGKLLKDAADCCGYLFIESTGSASLTVPAYAIPK